MTHNVQAHVHDPDPPKVRPSNAGRTLLRWKQHEIDKLHVLYNRGLTRASIAKELGMPEERIRQRLQWEAQSGTLLEARKRRRAAQRLVTKEEQRSSREFFDRVSVSARPTDEALQDRARRAAALPRDLAGYIFGDPPVGFSALERRA